MGFISRYYSQQDGGGTSSSSQKTRAELVEEFKKASDIRIGVIIGSAPPVTSQVDPQTISPITDYLRTDGTSYLLSGSGVSERFVIALPMDVPEAAAYFLTPDKKGGILKGIQDFYKLKIGLDVQLEYNKDDFNKQISIKMHVEKTATQIEDLIVKAAEQKPKVEKTTVPKKEIKEESKKEEKKKDEKTQEKKPVKPASQEKPKEEKKPGPPPAPDALPGWMGRLQRQQTPQTKPQSDKKVEPPPEEKKDELKKSDQKKDKKVVKEEKKEEKQPAEKKREEKPLARKEPVQEEQGEESKKTSKANERTTKETKEGKTEKKETGQGKSAKTEKKKEKSDTDSGFETEKKSRTKQEFYLLLKNLEAQLDVIGGFSSFDSLNTLQTAASKAQEFYNKLMQDQFSPYQDEVRGLVKKYASGYARTASGHKAYPRFMPCLQDAISENGELAVDSKTKAPQLFNLVDTFVKTMVAYNYFDRTVSDFVLRGVPLSDPYGFAQGYQLLKSPGPQDVNFTPFLKDILTSRYGLQGEGFKKVRELLGMDPSFESSYTQYFEIMDKLTGKNTKEQAEAYKIWHAFANRYPPSGSGTDPLSLVSGAGTGGQTTYSYLTGQSVVSQDQRNTFDFAGQLVCADTFGSKVRMLTSDALLGAIQTGASNLPAGTHALFYGRPAFFERAADFKGLVPINTPAPLQSPSDQTQMASVLQGDFYSTTTRNLRELYFMQTDLYKRHDTLSVAMDSFVKAMNSGKRIDDVQGKVADSQALSMGSIEAPMPFLGMGAVFNTNFGINVLGRLPYLSIFENFFIPELSQGMSDQPSDMTDNFTQNRYHADEYIRRLIYSRAMELRSYENYLHFIPGYEAVMAELSIAFNNARKNLLDLEWNPATQTASAFMGQGKLASSVGVDAQWHAQGINPNQTGTLEALYLPKEGMTQGTALGTLTNTDTFLGLKIWDLMGRVDRYIRGGQTVPGVTVTQYIEEYSRFNLDSSFGSTDGTLKANFWSFDTQGDSSPKSTYYGTAYLRSNGQWYKVVLDHDSIVQNGLKDALDHHFSMANVSLFSDNLVLRGAGENVLYGYPSQNYSTVRNGVMFVGELKPVLDVVGGFSRTKNKESADVGSIQVAGPTSKGEGAYVTVMNYHYNNRDLFSTGLAAGSAPSGLQFTSSLFRGSAPYSSYRLHEKPLENSSIQFSSQIAALEIFSDNVFRSTIFGGATSPGTVNRYQAMGGGELTLPRQYVGAALSRNESNKQIDRGIFTSYGQFPFLLSNTDYLIYSNYERNKQGLFYGGFTKRLGQKGDVGSISVFGTSNQLGNALQNSNLIPLTTQVKSFVGGLNNNPTRDDMVSWLSSLRAMGNLAVRQIPEYAWGNSPIYNLGIAYSNYRTKKDRTFWENLDGMFLFGGVRDASGNINATYSGVVDYNNEYALFGLYTSGSSTNSESYGGGLKWGTQTFSAGIYISKVPLPIVKPGDKPSGFGMLSFDMASNDKVSDKPPVNPALREYGGQTTGSISIGQEGSYKFHFMRADDSRDNTMFGQLDLFNYGLPGGRLSGQEVGLGYKPKAFDIAMLGITSLYSKWYGGVGRLQAGPLDGYTINIGTSVYNTRTKFTFDLKAMLDSKLKYPYWFSGLTCTYGF